MVLPTGVRNQHFGARVEPVQKVGADFQAAGASNRLNCCHPGRLNRLAVSPKDQCLNPRVIGCQAVDGQIAARLWGGHHGLFGSLYAAQQGQLALIVVVHANTQIDLCRVGVCCKLIVKAQNWVTGCHLDR